MILISSLSHIHIFNIGRLIHNEIFKVYTYEQVFILTHSLYFFYELTNINHEERKRTQKLFRLCKTRGKLFNTMKYEEIQKIIRHTGILLRIKSATSSYC